MAKENGLSYSTLQQDAEMYPNFGFGTGAFESLTKCEPSGILVFLSKGTTPTTFCLSSVVNAFLVKDLFP